MKFRDLPIASVFKFCDQVGFNIGRTFIKISARCYVEMYRPGYVSKQHYQVGTINVQVSEA